MGLVKEWFKLESDLEDEVLERYRTKERQVKGQFSGFSENIRQQERKREGIWCPAAFVTEFNRICEQIVSEGKD